MDFDEAVMNQNEEEKAPVSEAAETAAETTENEGTETTETEEEETSDVDPDQEEEAAEAEPEEEVETTFTNVTVTEIAWTNNEGSYRPTLTLTEEAEEGAEANSYDWTCNAQQLIDNKIGIGAKMVMGQDGDSKPYIAEITEESEDFQFPTCACGNQLDATMLISVNLRCNNPECSEKKEIIRNLIQNDIEQDEEFYNEEDKEGSFKANALYLLSYLQIPRFDPYSRFEESEEEAEEFGNKFYELIKANDGDGAFDLIGDTFSLSTLQEEMLTNKIDAEVAVLNGYFA